MKKTIFICTAIILNSTLNFTSERRTLSPLNLSFISNSSARSSNDTPPTTTATIAKKQFETDDEVSCLTAKNIQENQNTPAFTARTTASQQEVAKENCCWRTIGYILYTPLNECGQDCLRFATCGLLPLPQPKYTVACATPTRIKTDLSKKMD